MNDEILWTLGREAKVIASIGDAFETIKACRDETTSGLADAHLATAHRELKHAWRHTARELRDCIEVLISEFDEENA